jgi:hypothetical protein
LVSRTGLRGGLVGGAVGCSWFVAIGKEKRNNNAHLSRFTPLSSYINLSPFSSEVELIFNHSTTGWNILAPALVQELKHKRYEVWGNKYKFSFVISVDFEFSFVCGYGFVCNFDDFPNEE